ncbi:MAG TPA: flagellar hook-associated protein FlgK [Rhodocyclaceae bacterium]
MSFLSVGVTAINAAQLGLFTTEHNIANAATPGYNRQQTAQTTNTPTATGSGFIGQGTRVSTINRVYDQFIAAQVNQSQTRLSELETYYDEISRIDNMLGDPNSGLSPALQDFFRGVQQLAANPATAPSRQALVSSAEALVSRVQGLGARLGELYESVDGQIGSTVDAINSFAQQIAELNQQIVIAEAAVQQPANDLLDQRDHLIAELNKLIRVSPITESDGSISVFIGTGQQLVVSTRANTLSAQPALADPTRITVGLRNFGTIQELPESLINGGELAGLLRFRNESLDNTANQLGRLTASFALTFNAQHDLGQDLLGASGAANIADFFEIGAPSIVGNTLNGGNAAISGAFVAPPPMRLNNGAFSLTYDVTTAAYTVHRLDGSGLSFTDTDLPTLLDTVETATGARLDLANGNFMTQVGTSDYRLTFLGGGNYSLRRLSDNLTFGPDTLANLSALIAPTEGFTLANPSGAPAVGDTFLIRPTRDIADNFTLNAAIVSDPRRIAAALPVRSETGATNLGSGRITVESLVPGYVAPAAASPFTLTYDVATNAFTVGGLAAGTTVAVTTPSATTVTTLPATVPYAADALYTVNGITFRLSGSPGQGDSFRLEANTAGIADARNALALGELQTQQTIAGGTTNFQSAYAQLVSSVGNKSREIRVTRDAQTALRDQAVASREAMSGVNLDEEAANLLRYQQAYQAAARVMQVSGTLFEELLSIGR